MKSKYVDTPAIVNVIGNIYKNPELLEQTDKYVFYTEDFPEDFHRILFGSIYNLHQLGAKEITPVVIEDYLQHKTEKFGVYKYNNGRQYLDNLEETVSFANFDYYYERMKKMTLFRAYEKIGFDTKWLYDVDNVLDGEKRQREEEWLDNTSIDEIANIIDEKIIKLRSKYVENSTQDFAEAGTGVLGLVERLKQNPEIGLPLFGDLINEVHRGARLKKLYLRSAPTGVSKTRAMIGDCCYIACDELYNVTMKRWEKNNYKEPTLFITTEQEVEEIQTMMLAFLSGVNETKILTGNYVDDEEDRVLHAAKILEESPIYIKEMPDFSLQDIENTIKYAIRKWNCHYIFHDYLHSSMKILSEVSSRTKVAGLREDNILFMMAVKLKDICNQYNVFIMTSTQLNGDYKNAKVFDQNLLRGSKSISDRIDFGCIVLETTEEDKAAILDIVKEQGIKMPDIKISIYKNRRGRYKNILLWCHADRGICRINPVFATTYNYEIVPIDNLKIEVTK